MQFSLTSCVLLFVVFVSSLLAFGPWGLLITLMAFVLGGFFQSLKARRNRRTWLLILLVTAIVLFFLIVPSLQEVRESSRRAACENNLKQLGLALHNYHHDHGSFPPAYVADEQGRPMHSWRTLILPHLEEGHIYQDYNFKEPWNGPNNQKLATTAIQTFRCPSATGKDETRTSYLAVTGPGTAWSGERGSKLEDFTDGPDKTILLVELADSDVHWMEPRDVTLEEALGPPGEGTRVPVGRHYTRGDYVTRSMPAVGWVLMADGSVRLLPDRLSREDLATLLSIGGGEPVDLQAILAPDGAPSASLRWDHCIGLPVFLVSLLWFWLRLLADASVAKDGASDDPGGPGS